MASLCYKSLAAFINDNNLPALQQYLDNKQVHVDDRDDNGATALMLAASRGRTSHILALLSAGADPHLTDNDNWTALHCAARAGHTDICLQLIDAASVANASTHTGATVAAANVLEQRDMGGWTPLMWAAYKGHVQTLGALLERGADVNVHGNYHVPSLVWAAGRGHVGVVEALLQAGAKVNAADKYGTTALIWASRRGHTDVVRLLLQAGAAVDTAGMYSWTALLVAAAGDHGDVVHLLLERRPNVNALDKDGCSALMLACKDGYYEVATALMSAGAYINVQDRAGDTNLIHAVKGGHRGVVEALLKRYADVDVTGKDRKTALYMAVEKGNPALVRLLLHSNPDLEVATKDADTALLKAVRSRNAEIVQVLLDKRAKPTAADRKGDTCLHIAMRARSRAIVEILLRNPKHSHLLYRPNRAGETPYNIDLAHQKTILGQIFGARRLNANEDNEGMLGYDLYSSALADILSEPTLTMPITVGLYAKWGSGKSFLLGKLRDEMKNFARHHQPPHLSPSLTLTVLLLHVALIFGTVAGLAGDRSWVTAVVVTASILVGSHVALGCLWLLAAQQQKHGRWALGDWEWAHETAIWVAERVEGVRRVMQVAFCHPPSYGAQDEGTVQPIRFYFTEQTRVSTSSGGENSVVQMVGSLYDAIESDYGSVATRLYRAFKPRPSKTNTSGNSDSGSTTWTWRKVCCVPYIILFEITFVCALAGSTALVLYLTMPDQAKLEQEQQLGVERTSLEVILFTTGSVLVIAVLSNLYTMARVCSALMFSQRRHLQRTIAKLDTLRSEGFLHALRQEVLLLQDMVRCLDALTLQQQSRLVVIVDGLDSSEQEKVLLVLDSVRTLFIGSTSSSSPFIVILAIDPHVISRAVEAQHQRSQHAVGVGGHAYLANMVHLPFYLQNSGLRKVAAAQQAAAKVRLAGNSEEGLVMGRSLSARRLSSETALMSASTERLGTAITSITSTNANRKGSRKLRLSESVASSIGSNLNRLGSTIAAQPGGAQQQQQHDLSRMLLTDDYFSDVNPRSMRRLMNVIYVTGRLLKAFKIDFSWYRLASWINITEQWPFRTSHLIHHFELTSGVDATDSQQFDDNTPLKVLYDRIRASIPNSREVEPLLELDRGDERKFDVFLSYHRSTLQVADLKVFLPFTINLDPYLRKVIKEECCQQELIDTTFLGGNNAHLSPQTHHHVSASRSAVVGTPSLANGGSGFVGDWPSPPARRSNERIAPPQHVWAAQQIPMWPQAIPIAPVTPIPASVLDTPLSTLSLDAMCVLLERTLNPDISPERMRGYIDALRANNVSGRVLAHCELSSSGGGELRQLLGMTFGDWELFRVLVVSMRADEVTKMQMVQQPQRYHCHNAQPQQKQQQAVASAEEPSTTGGGNKNVGSDIDGSSSSSNTKLQHNEASSGSTASSRNKQSIMEKQVTLEDQMICGALQTLNEEACEDVLEEVGLDLSVVPVNIGGAPTCLIVPPSPDAALQELQQLTGGGGNTGGSAGDDTAVDQLLEVKSTQPLVRHQGRSKLNLL